MKLAITSSGQVDLQFGTGGLQAEVTLESAVILSLLTDRRALPDDRLPDDSGRTTLLPPDRRGWCGDALAEDDASLIGSRLWLISREKQTEETRRRAIFYAREALQWLVNDGHAVSMTVDAAWTERGRLEVSVILNLPDGTSFSKLISIGGAYAV